MKYLHTMIRVKDLESNIEFFKKLGMVVTKRSDYEKGKFTLVFLSADEDEENANQTNSPLIELTYNWDSKEEYKLGRSFGHLAYSVDNIYQFCQRLIDQGIELNRPPRDGYMAFIKTPEGVSIELLQKGESLPQMEPWASMENIGSW